MMATSCEKTIEELDFSDQKEIYVRAILNNGPSADNKISCYRLYQKKVTTLDDATIKIYINGELSEVVSNEKPNSNNPDYPIKSTFRPGDKVRMELTSPKGEVWAETVVPEPIDIISADTLKTTAAFDKDIDPMLCYKVMLDMKANGNPGNYRIMAGYKTETIGTKIYYDFSRYDIAFQRDTVLIDSLPNMNIKDDAALTDGKGYVEKDDEMLEMDVEYINHYQLISGSYFNGGRYKVSFYVEPMPWYINSLWGRGYTQGGSYPFVKGHIYRHLDEKIEIDGRIHECIVINKSYNEYIQYQLFSISDEEHTYLRGRSNQIDIDYSDSQFVEPVILKGNIHGGLGIFAIESVTEGEIKLTTPIVNWETAAIYY